MELNSEVPSLVQDTEKVDLYENRGGAAPNLLQTRVPWRVDQSNSYSYNYFSTVFPVDLNKHCLGWRHFETLHFNVIFCFFSGNLKSGHQQILEEEKKTDIFD